MLRLADLSDEQIDLLGFLGELMLRLLKMLVLPLIAGSMIAGKDHILCLLTMPFVFSEAYSLMRSLGIIKLQILLVGKSPDRFRVM